MNSGTLHQHRHINTSTHQHTTNTVLKIPTNTSTHQHINSLTPQHQLIDTPQSWKQKHNINASNNRHITKSSARETITVSSASASPKLRRTKWMWGELARPPGWWPSGGWVYPPPPNWPSRTPFEGIFGHVFAWVVQKRQFSRASRKDIQDDSSHSIKADKNLHISLAYRTAAKRYCTFWPLPPPTHTPEGETQ
jgi:hypothetical protein